MDSINPNHYKQRKYQCIDFTRLMSFNLGNAFKYIWRMGDKPGADAATDYEKAMWYLTDYVGTTLDTSINDEQADALIRKLSIIRDQLGGQQCNMLLAIIIAAAGDASAVLDIVREHLAVDLGGVANAA